MFITNENVPQGRSHRFGRCDVSVLYPLLFDCVALIRSSVDAELEELVGPPTFETGRAVFHPQRSRHGRNRARAGAAQRSVRVAGAGHSHAPLVLSDGVIVDASGLAGVVSIDAASKRAWVWSGTRIYALGRALHDQGLALANQGDIDRQAIAGAVATGTHGTGRTLQNLTASVTGIRLVAASGDIIECNAQQNAELFRAARLNLGAFGIVTQLQLQLADAYRLQERGWSEPYETLMPKLDALIAQSRHFEFFWYPHTDVAVAKSTNDTTRRRCIHWPKKDRAARGVTKCCRIIGRCCTPKWNTACRRQTVPRACAKSAR